MKRVSVLFLALSVVVIGFLAWTEEPSETGNALVILSFDLFSYNEYILPRRVFQQEGINVTVASSELGKATSSSNRKVDVDVLLEDVDVSEYDAVVFIGGWGALEYFEDEQALRICQQAAEQGKVLAAICIAPVILANAGVLEGRQVTGSYDPSTLPWSKEALEAGGATYVEEDVVVSAGSETQSTIITASGPQASHDFGNAIVAALKCEAQDEAPG